MDYTKLYKTIEDCTMLYSIILHKIDNTELLWTIPNYPGYTGLY